MNQAGVDYLLGLVLPKQSLPQFLVFREVGAIFEDFIGHVEIFVVHILLTLRPYALQVVHDCRHSLLPVGDRGQSVLAGNQVGFDVLVQYVVNILFELVEERLLVALYDLVLEVPVKNGEAATGVA